MEIQEGQPHTKYREANCRGGGEVKAPLEINPATMHTSTYISFLFLAVMKSLQVTEHLNLLCQH